MRGENKWMVILIIGIVMLGAAIYYSYSTEPAEFRKGVEVNEETFSALLSDADTIYIVMDIRDVSNDLTRRNILQCGVDLAGSSGLAGRNVTYVSFDNSMCIMASLNGLNRTTGVKECVDMLNSDGISLYVHEGNAIGYYSRAAMVGVWDTYVLGTCSVNEKG